MRNPQVSSTVTNELYEVIEALAVKENRSMSDMVSLLLQLAVKEKTRKRKGDKENNPQHNPTNTRTGHPE